MLPHLLVFDCDGEQSREHQHRRLIQRSGVFKARIRKTAILYSGSRGRKPNPSQGNRKHETRNRRFAHKDCRK